MIFAPYSDAVAYTPELKLLNRVPEFYTRKFVVCLKDEEENERMAPLMLSY